jgi:hypothetical protein
MGYGLERSFIPGRGRDFSFLHNVQTGTGAHSLLLHKGYWGLFLEA